MDFCARDAATTGPGAGTRGPTGRPRGPGPGGTGSVGGKPGQTGCGDLRNGLSRLPGLDAAVDHRPESSRWHDGCGRFAAGNSRSVWAATEITPGQHRVSRAVVDNDAGPEG